MDTVNIKTIIPEDEMHLSYTPATSSINVDEEGSESHHHILIFLCLNETSVASFIFTVLDEPADMKGEGKKM